MLAGQSKKKNKEMTDKTKEELIEEIRLLQKRIAGFEKNESRRKELEDKVIRRSVELARTNVDLQDEIKGREKANTEIAALKKQMEFILGATKTGLDIIDSDYNMVYIDPEWQKVYGDPKGKKCYEYFMGRSKVCSGCGIAKALETKKPVVIEETLVREGNRPIEVTTIPFQDEHGNWLVAEVNVDITERKKAERKIDLSLRDTHTELYNYRYLMERLESEVNRARRYVLPLSVIMLDIDYFKSINDVYGHQYGDIILREFAQYLKNFARNVDIVTRYGGEEFAIVLPDTNKNSTIMFSKRLLDAIGRYTFDPEDKKIKLKVSMGIASFPEDGSDIGTASGLINSADKALLDAKEKGGNKFCTFKDISKDIKDIVEKGGKEDVEELRVKLSKMSDRVHKTLLESIYAFAKTISAKDHYTGEQAENMVSIAIKIGERLNLSSAVIKTLEQAAILHDLGKVGVPYDILHKKEKLTKEEYEVIKKHPQIGAEIIRPVNFLDGLVPIILYHHERFDGLGYSVGLKGKEIPLGARIIAIADAYQALVSDRPYRKAYSEKEALKIIGQGSGMQFDPEIVKAFLAIMRSKPGK